MHAHDTSGFARTADHEKGEDWIIYNIDDALLISAVLPSLSPGSSLEFEI